MPLPAPEKNESHDDWMARCMAHPTMHDDYPDADQRAAVCESQWERRKKAEEALVRVRRWVSGGD
jgi:hypothetical protein